jgi:hypothetical protein
MNDTLLTQSGADTAASSTSSVPEKFKDPQTGELNTQALLNSYLALERRFSEKSVSVPNAPEEYCIECTHGLFEPDTEINQRLYGKGFSQEQAQEVYDLAAERLVPLIMDVAAEFQAEREIDRLVDHFGGPDQWREVSRQLLQYGQQNLPPEVLKGMANSYEGVLALHAMMKGEKPAMPTPRVEKKTSVDEKDLHSLMRSPKYWREKDPSVVAKVTDGFKKLYGSN